MRDRPEEALVRNAMVALSRAYPTALIMRNEANACTALLRACQREIDRHLTGFDMARTLASKAVGSAYSTITDAIKYGLGVGSADVIVCHRGMFIALEFKAPGGVQSDAQRTWQAWVTRAGGRYTVVRSVDEAIAAAAVTV